MPRDQAQAQAPSADNEDALWALVRLWSDAADRPPRTRRYWTDLAERAREARAAAGSRSGETQVPDRLGIPLDRLGRAAFEQLVRLLARAESDRDETDGEEPDDPAAETAAARSSDRGHHPVLHRTGDHCTPVPLYFDSPDRAPSEAASRMAWYLDALANKFAGSGELPSRVVVHTNAHRARFTDLVDRAAQDSLLRQYPSLKVQFLFHDDLCSMLRKHPAVFRMFAAFFTPGDSLGQDVGLYTGQPVKESAALISSVTAGELIRDQWVRLGQAGDERDQQKLTLGPIAIDLDAVAGTSGSATVPSARYILERGDHVLRPSVHGGDGGQLRNIALIGGPGQGKSTLGQLVSQAYRAALLGEDGAGLYPATTRTVLHGLHEDLAAAGIPRPKARRWPIRVALHDFANHLTNSTNHSLMHYLWLRIDQRLPRSLSAEQWEQWLATWPWFLVLDGLDEVSAPEMREMVMTSVEEFLLHVRRLDADHLILATTRPQGYRDEFHVGNFEPLRLAPLSLRSALHYAQRLAKARHGDDPELQEAVVSRFTEATREPNTARLMGSPLQVTIMTLLVERRTRMPQNRYELFEAYYTTIYNREVDKPGDTGKLLAEHRAHIDWLHQFVGLTLQSRAAWSRELDSVMPEWEVHDRSRRRLIEETENRETAERLAGRLFNAAAERLVLLVAPEAGRIGFEVRSLQEFMAARALISGPEAEILPRLQQLVASESWNNTWLLAAAGIFTHRPHLRDGLLTVLRAADEQDRASMVLRPGARLAADLIEDDLARTHPRHHRLLVAHATELLDGPPGPRMARFATLLGQLSVQSAETRDIVDRAVGKALQARDARLATGLLLLDYWGEGERPRAREARELRLRSLASLEPPVRMLLSVTLGDGGAPTEPLHLVNQWDQLLRSGPSEPLVEVLRPFLAKHCIPGTDLSALNGRMVWKVLVGGLEMQAASGQRMSSTTDLSVPGGLRAAIADAIDSLPLNSWFLAMQLYYWLHDLARLPDSEPERPHVAGVC